MPSRRDVVRGLATGVGLGAIGFPMLAEAKKRRRKKTKKKAKPNSYGCLNVGDPCKSEDQCCSGICEGKSGKRKCRAHDAGTCKPQGGFCTEPDPGLYPCNNVINCWCFRTTANSIFCGDLASEKQPQCTDCQKDADCVALGFSEGSACLPFAEGACTAHCESGMMCMSPCIRGQAPGAN